MADYMIHETTLRGIANAIRTKTGNSAPIPVSAMAEQITEIETGGSSEDVRYVTFMSHDGTVELGKKPVAVGDNCADPIARGLFATPTKESSVQYDYSFAGWATTANGPWDKTALNAITEDKTVYAAFASLVRYYTARFYDGSTLIGSVQTAYGEQAVPPDATKPGYTLKGWTPSDLTIYGDTDFVGNWEQLSALYYVTTVPVYVSDVEVSPDGKRMIAGLDNVEMTSPVVYDISGEAPVQITTAVHTANPIYGTSCSYDRTGNYFFLRGIYNNKGRLFKYNASGNCGMSGYAYPSSGSYMRCSPFADKLALPGSSGKADIYNTALSMLFTTENISVSNGAYYFSFSPNGSYLAVGFRNGTAAVFNASNGSLVKNLNLSNVRWVSYSGDNRKLAVVKNVAPYVEVYETTTWTKLCDFGEFCTTTSCAEFLSGTHILVVGCGTTVKAFDFSGNTPQEIDGLPTYAGGTISLIKSNHPGTRIAIYGGGKVEIWGKLV